MYEIAFALGHVDSFLLFTKYPRRAIPQNTVLSALELISPVALIVESSQSENMKFLFDKVKFNKKKKFSVMYTKLRIKDEDCASMECSVASDNEELAFLRSGKCIAASYSVVLIMLLS